MNAPLNRKQVDTSLLLAANKTLVLRYLTKPESCICLLISRNYHLLAQQPNTPELRLTWMKESKYWWQSYLKKSTGKYADFALLIGDEPVFKRVHF